MAAQIRVVALSDSAVVQQAPGVPYFLPMTMLEVDFTLLKNITESGPYGEFADEFLCADQADPATKAGYRITAVQVNTHQVPDPGHAYRILQKKKWPGIFRKDFRVSLTGEGFLSGINAGRNKKTGGINKQSGKSGLPERENIARKGGEFLYLVNPDLKRKPENDRVTTDSTLGPPVMKPFIKPEDKVSTPKEKARQAVETLAVIRENRLNLASGYQEVAYPEGTIRTMLWELNAMEEGIMNLFTGVTREETSHYRNSWIPFKLADNSFIAGWFSPVHGITGESRPGSLPLLIEWCAGDPLSVPEFEPVTKKKKTTNGLVCRVPASVRIRVFLEDEVLYEGLHPVSQLGIIYRLPEKIKSVSFYPETGSIKFLRQ